MRSSRSGERIAERTVCPRHFIAIPRWRSWPTDPRIGRRGPAKAHMAFLHPGQASRSNWPSPRTAQPRRPRAGTDTTAIAWSAAGWRDISTLGPHTGDNITRDVRAGAGMSVGCARTHPFHIHCNRQALAVFVPERAIKRTITRHLPTSRTWVTRLTSSCTGAGPLETTLAQVVITGARGTEPAVRRLSEPERVAHGETNGPRERDQRSRALVTRG